MTVAGFTWDAEQAEAEWERHLDEARTQNAFLRPVHVLAMACVMKRPIVMYADKVLHNAWGEAVGRVPFAGVYLPFLCEPNVCSRQPLAMVYGVIGQSNRPEQILRVVFHVTTAKTRCLLLCATDCRFEPLHASGS